jgi:Four helix bundle sensory module for signal transduction
LTIARRLTILLALPLVALLFYSVIGYSQLSLARSRIGVVINHDVPSVVTIGRIARGLAAAQADMQDLLQEPDTNRRIRSAQNYFNDKKALLLEFDRYMAEYISDNTDRHLVVATKDQLHQWLNSADEIVKSATAGQPGESLRVEQARSRAQADRLIGNFDGWAASRPPLKVSPGETTR